MGTLAEEKKVRYNEEIVKGEVIKKSGQEMAKASAKAKGDKIAAEGNLEQMRSKAKAEKIESDATIGLLEMDFKKIEDQEREKNKMELDKIQKMNEIEIKKFKHMVTSIGRDTIIAMAKS